MQIQSGYCTTNSFTGKGSLIIGKEVEETLAKEVMNNAFLNRLSKKHDVKVAYDVTKDVFTVSRSALNNGLCRAYEHKVTITVDGKKYNLISKDYDMGDNAIRALRKNLQTLNSTTVDIGTGKFKEKRTVNIIPFSLKAAAKKTLKAIKQFFYIEHKNHKKY